MTALLMPGAVGHELLSPHDPVEVEHPTGKLAVTVELDGPRVRRAGVIRTARMLFDGTVFPRPTD